VGESDNMGLRFSVSHSDGIALYGFSRDRDIDVDVERMRSAFATEEIAERFFAPGELSALRALPSEMREGFLQFLDSQGRLRQS
jgi:4'-phosphopantetheinyl transferase